MVALVFGLYFECTCIARCLDLGVFVAGNGFGWTFSMEWPGSDCGFGS